MIPNLSSHTDWRSKTMSNSFLTVYPQDLILESMLFRVSLPLRSSRLSPPNSEDHSRLQNSPMSNFCHFKSTTLLLHTDATRLARKEIQELMEVFISTLRTKSLAHMDANSNGKLRKVQSSTIHQKVLLLLKASLRNKSPSYF